MKNVVAKLLILLAVMVFVTPLSAAFVTLVSPTISPKPLDAMEDNGAGVITLGMIETSNAMAPAKDIFGDPNIQISMELNKLALTDGNTALITGTLLNYFSASMILQVLWDDHCLSLHKRQTFQDLVMPA